MAKFKILKRRKSCFLSVDLMHFLFIYLRTLKTVYLNRISPQKGIIFFKSYLNNLGVFGLFEIHEQKKGFFLYLGEEKEFSVLSC